MISNVIFDIDGTLWDSTGVVAVGWERAVKETGYSKAEITADILKKEFGLPMNIIADHVFYDLGDEGKKAELLALCCKYEHEELEKNTRDISYEGISEVIHELSGKYRVFIVSNCQKGYIELVMDKLGITDDISGHLCYGDTGLTKGETMQELMGAEGIDPGTSVYVGDTAGDRQAAEYAGVRFIYARYGFGNLEGEEFSIDSPAELAGLLDEFTKDRDR